MSYSIVVGSKVFGVARTAAEAAEMIAQHLTRGVRPVVKQVDSRKRLAGMTVYASRRAAFDLGKTPVFDLE